MSLLETLLDAPLPEDDLLPLRRAGQQRLRQLGLPGPRDEAWRYTPLRGLLGRRFDGVASGLPDATACPAWLLALVGPRLVFVDGVYHPAWSDLDGLPAGLTIDTDLHGSDPATERSQTEHAFVAANLALAGQGARIHVASGTRLTEPLLLLWIDQAVGHDGLRHARIEIELGAGATLQLEERRLSDPASSASASAPLTNRLMEVTLASDAYFSHVLFGVAADRASVIAHSRYRLAAQAHVEYFELCPGAALYRHALEVELAGAGARFRSGGVQAAAARRHAEVAIDVRHLAADTTCELVWRGLAEGRGRLAFGGRLVIAVGADGSDARLSSKNLLLSADAEIDTRPVLEIHADDVRAAHGATVGSLDDNALFYLRSRGLPEAAARALLTRAFAFEALAVVEDATMRARIETELPALLPGLAELA